MVATCLVIMEIGGGGVRWCQEKITLNIWTILSNCLYNYNRYRFNGFKQNSFNYVGQLVKLLELGH